MAHDSEIATVVYPFASAESGGEIYRREHTVLNTQYKWLKKGFDHPQLLPEEIQLSQLSNVLEIAAGTGVWAFDLASQPGVKERTDSGNMRIVASDIDMDKLPPNELARKHGVELFQHDITKPFPPEMHGHFDLVRMSLVVFSLTGEMWHDALRNIYQVLRPGGYLIAQDLDTVLYSLTGPPFPPLEGADHDFESAMQGESTLAKINALYAGKALQRNLIPGLSFRLPDLLRSSSFVIEKTYRVLLPIGSLCESQLSRGGSSMAESQEDSAKNFSRVFDMFTRALLEKDELEAPVGVHIGTEDARRILMRDIEEELQGGAAVLTTEWVAKRCS